MSDQGVTEKKLRSSFFQESRTMPKKPESKKTGQLFTAPIPSENFLSEENEESGGRGNTLVPAKNKITSPDLATPGLFAGKSATDPKLSPKLNQQIRSHSASGLAARPFFGDQRPKKVTPPTENLANPNSRINRVLGPRLGRKG